jgi:hypothetical protein
LILILKIQAFKAIAQLKLIPLKQQIKDARVDDEKQEK